MKKNIPIGGFTTKQREKYLIKIKEKFAKKEGYTFIEYKEDGAAKSYAVFEVEDKIIFKNKIKKYSITGVIVFIVLFIVFLPTAPYEKYKNYTLEKTRELTANQIKNIALDYQQMSNIPVEYEGTFYDCLSQMIYTKERSYTVDKMLTWCKQFYERGEFESTVYVNYAELMNDFSIWNGSYKPLENLIKSNMNDPKSYEHVKTNYRVVNDGKKPYMIVSAKFRGTNAFGAIVTNSVTIKVDTATKQIEVME